MAYTKDREVIFKIMRDQGVINFEVYDNDRKTVIYDHETGEGTPEQAVDDLKQILQSLAGTLWIKLSNKSKGSKGEGGTLKNNWLRLDLGNESGNHGMNGAMQLHNQPIDMAALETSIRAKVESELAVKNEMAELRAEIRQLQQVHPMVGFLERNIGPYTPHLVNSMFGAEIIPVQPMNGAAHPYPPNNTAQPPATIPAGTEPAKPLEKPPVDEIKRIELGVSKWLGKDRGATDLIEKIAELAEANPMAYNIAKAQLLAMNNQKPKE